MKMLQLKIQLLEIEPKIWRRFIVADNITFHKLHEIIQVVMGWGNCHLYEFCVKQFHFGIPEDKYDVGVASARKVKLNEFLKIENQKFSYIYDFGDDWNHKIVIEKIFEKDLPDYLPLCLDGKRACPPEDCGSVPGYYELMEAMADKKHPHRKELLEWLGGSFDPEYFDIKQVNEKLSGTRNKKQRLNRGWVMESKK